MKNKKLEQVNRIAKNGAFVTIGATALMMALPIFNGDDQFSIVKEVYPELIGYLSAFLMVMSICKITDLLQSKNNNKIQEKIPLFKKMKSEMFGPEKSLPFSSDDMYPLDLARSFNFQKENELQKKIVSKLKF